MNYRWTLLRAGEFRLDAGSMFGLIPRTVWSKMVPIDDRGRMTVQHNCLLLERAADGPGPKHVLLEVGTGDKLDERSRDLFAMSDRSILTALHEADCKPEDIDLVTMTHLHFDHAGGLTRLARQCEKPDWVGPASCFSGSRGEHGVKLSFPNAKIVTQTREWADAMANRSVMTRTYFTDHLEPLAGVITKIDSPRPFITGQTPDRAEIPRLAIEQRTTEIAPGIRVFLVPGHTWGQQAMMFDDHKGRTVVFCPDVLPTAWHNGAAYSLGYDVEPYTSMVSRHWLLSEAADRGWLLVLDHEPGNPVRRVKRNDKGWFDLIEDAP